VFNELKFIIGAIPDTYIKLLQVYVLLKCIRSINSDVFWQSIISLRRIEEVSAGMRNAGDIFVFISVLLTSICTRRKSTPFLR
jgi:hypothetical protein